MATDTVTSHAIDAISRQAIDNDWIPLRPGEFAVAAATSHPTVVTRIKRQDRLVHDLLTVVTVWRRPMRFVRLSALANCGQMIQVAEIGRDMFREVRCGACAQIYARQMAEWTARRGADFR